MLGDGQVGDEGVDLGLRHVCRVAEPVKADVPPHPQAVGLLGAAAVVARPQGALQLVDELGHRPSLAQAAAGVQEVTGNVTRPPVATRTARPRAARELRRESPVPGEATAAGPRYVEWDASPHREGTRKERPMERRSAAVTVALVLSLAALAVAGSFIASAPAPSQAAGLPQPAPALMAGAAAVELGAPGRRTGGVRSRRHERRLRRSAARRRRRSQGPVDPHPVGQVAVPAARRPRGPSSGPRHQDDRGEIRRLSRSR